MDSFKEFKNTIDREFLDIENHPDMPQDERVARVIQVCSATAAVIAIQPVPMADFALQLPILGYMGYKIGRIRGVDIREHDATRLTGEIVATVGMSFATRQVIAGLYKTAFPFLGALTTLPLFFALVYSVGKVMDYYFRAQAAGEEPSREAMNDVFVKAQAEGVARGKALEREKERGKERGKEKGKERGSKRR